MSTHNQTLAESVALLLLDASFESALALFEDFALEARKELPDPERLESLEASFLAQCYAADEVALRLITLPGVSEKYDECIAELKFATNLFSNTVN